VIPARTLTVEGTLTVFLSAGFCRRALLSVTYLLSSIFSSTPRNKTKQLNIYHHPVFSILAVSIISQFLDVIKDALLFRAIKIKLFKYPLCQIEEILARRNILSPGYSAPSRKADYQMP